MNGRDLALFLGRWGFDPTLLVPLAAAGVLYLAGVRRVDRRYPRSGWPPIRSVSFFTGLVLLYLVLLGPVGEFDDVFFWDHMVQHMVLTMVAPPLLLLGSPTLLALRASAPSARRRFLRPILHSRVVRGISHPVIAWLLFAGTYVGTHFSPFYEYALTHPPVHDYVEHPLYLVTGLLFFWPVVAADASPWRLPPPVRILYLLAFMPVNTFTSIAIRSARGLLYPYYATVARPFGPGPMTDQLLAGSIMWIGGSLIMLGWILLAAMRWYLEDRTRTEHLDARLATNQPQRANAPGGLWWVPDPSGGSRLVTNLTVPDEDDSEPT